jgi:hypothetical protein
LTKVALIQAERRDFDAAVQTVGLIGDASQRDHALQQVATARAESGSILAALEIAESIEDAYFGSVALRQIGLAQLARGDRAGCRETLRRALHRLKGVEVGGGVKVLILQETGAALLKAGDKATATTAFQQAREAAANYQDEAYRARLLQGIAKCQAEGGQASDALDWAAESPVPVVKARALLGVAEGLLARSKPQPR